MSNERENAILNFLCKKSKKYIEALTHRRKKVLENIKDSKKEFLVSKDGQEMVRGLINITRENLYRTNNRLKWTKKRYSRCPDSEDWFFEWKISEIEQEIKKLENRLWRFKNMLLVNGMPMIECQTTFDLEKIKEIPIDFLLDTPPQYSTNERSSYKCPLHEEKNASFVWYKNNNTWYCFGCSKGGDIIQLYQDLYGTDFITACKTLSKDCG